MKEILHQTALRNYCNFTKVESSVSNDIRHMVLDLAELTGLGKSMVHRILKSLENVKTIRKTGSTLII